MSFENDNLDTYTKDELIKIVQTSMQEKESLEYLVNQLHGISWEFDIAQNKFSYVSSGAKDVLGYEIDEWTDMNSWINMIHEDDREEISSYCMLETADAQDYSMEYKMVKKTGETIWVLDVVKLGKNDENKAIKLYGFIIDITQKKEKQLEIEKEHQFLQTIINGISDPIMIINKDYSVPLMNEKVRKTLEGRTFIDPKNPKCYEISHFRDTPCEGIDDPCPLKDVLESGKITKVMHNHKHKDGSDQFVELAAAPLFDDCNNCTGIIESARDITAYVQLVNELEKKGELLKHQATHDYLTGLPNRALFMDRLEQAILDTARNKTSLALFFLDLDHFKEVNDTYGHHMGDEVLREVCKLFKSQTRSNDVLSRLGGDEFTIIMKDFKSVSDIETLAKKFVKIFEKPLLVDGNSLTLSTSIGISIFNGGNESSEELLQHADDAMYEAKDNGKNTFVFYDKQTFTYSQTSHHKKYL